MMPGDGSAKKSEPATDNEDPVGGGSKGDKEDKSDSSDRDRDRDKEDGEDKADRETKRDKGDEDEDGDRKGRKRTARGEDDEEIDGVDVVPVKMTPHTANRAAIRVDFGPSASSRTPSWRSSSRSRSCPSPSDSAPRR